MSEVSSRYREFIDSIIDDIPTMIFIKDAEDLSFVGFNKAAERLTGFMRHDVLGKSDYDFFPKEQADFFRHVDQDVLNRNSEADVREEVIRTKGQGERFLHTRKVRVKGPNERDLILGISEDITERKQYEMRIKNLLDAEKQARQIADRAVKTRDEFLSIASHELKNPLSALKLRIHMAQRILEKGMDCQFLAKHLKAIDSDIDRFASLIERLFDISQIQSGKLSLHKSQFSLLALARKAADRLEPDFKRAGCTIQISGSESLGKWDYARLEQVIVNLLTNAMKYAPGKPVEIKITESEKDVVCEVRDHGKGIAEADRARIFQLFERASDQEGGLGLGLYIVRQIVESHQGSISVESSMGNGTSFSVRLPKNI